MKNKSLNLAKYCREHDISYNTVYARIKRGMTVEEAISNPIIKRASIIKNPGICKKCRELGLNYKFIYGRVFQKKMTLEEAMNTPKYYARKFYKGIPYTVYCKQHNIPIERIKQRMRKGMTLEEAIETPVKRNRICQ